MHIEAILISQAFSCRSFLFDLVSHTFFFNKAFMCIRDNHNIYQNIRDMWSTIKSFESVTRIYYVKKINLYNGGRDLRFWSR